MMRALGRYSRWHYPSPRPPSLRTPAPTSRPRWTGGRPLPGSTPTPTARPTTAGWRAAPGCACTLSIGNGFGATIVSEPVDAGYPEARLWGDVDGDHRADYCRRVGGGAAGNRLSCSHSTGSGFATDLPTAPLDWGVAPDTAMADATGDGRGDYCRLTVGR